MRILIVDDDTVSRLMLAAVLKQLGHEVTAAADGRRGWEEFVASPFPVVITDQQMPEMDGLELCQRIKAGAHAAHVVLLTAESPERVAGPAHEAGVDALLSKPVDRDGLRTILEQVTSGE
jgi:CheY-like chemotaxis protein